MQFLYSKLHPFDKNYILEALLLCVETLFCSVSSKDMFFTSTS